MALTVWSNLLFGGPSATPFCAMPPWPSEVAGCATPIRLIGLPKDAAEMFLLGRQEESVAHPRDKCQE